MALHKLKIESQFLDAIKSGHKTFEIRNNDRGFQAGDTLELEEVDSCGLRTPGQNQCLAEVLYVLNGWGLKDGYVCMAIKLITTNETQ